MGKAFANELSQLLDTIAWANDQDINELQRFVSETSDLPLVAIGSGGSITACHLATLLHRIRHKQPSFFTSPLDVLLLPAGLHQASVLLASASGKNKDVLAALNACIVEEVPALAVITLKSTNQLKSTASTISNARVFAADSPSGKDGFLATNSLVATCSLLTRAYGFDLLLSQSTGTFYKNVDFKDRHMIHVLHGGWGSPVATDLESKLNESALASAQIADYRNFGHGRHLWLAKRPDETVVIALITPETEGIANATLKLFPKNIPVIRLETTLDGPSGSIDLLLQSFHLVQLIGTARGNDPGRPHVPEFGRKLYRLSPPKVKQPIQAPVLRKLWVSPETKWNTQAFQDSFKLFLSRARTSKIGAIAIDYDGTMCSKDSRWGGLREDIVTECSRLLSAGLQIGIATGRGKSVRNELQKTLAPELWPLVHIGYYNGTDIGNLGDDSHPKLSGPTDLGLQRAHTILKADDWLNNAVTIEFRPKQITVIPDQELETHALAAYIMTRLAPLDGESIRIVVSSHSLDILGASRGKGVVVNWLSENIGDGLDVLCIGDKGAWPGNDFTLLSEPISLSVDEISSLKDTCWNLAPSGVSGPDATLLYLRAIQTSRGVGTFNWKETIEQ